MAEKIVVDPIGPFKRRLAQMIRGRNDEEKLDIFTREGYEARVRRDLSEGELRYARNRVEKLLKKVRRRRHVTSDGQLEASFGTHLTLKNEDEAEHFRRFVERNLGREKSRKAVVEEKSFKVNEDIAKELEKKGLKEPYCKRCGKMRLTIRPVTSATKRGTR